MANATVRIITDTEAVILSKGANEALTGRLAYASDKKKLYVGNGTKFVVATDTEVTLDAAKDYTDTAIDEFGDQVYSKEVIDNKIDPITEDIDAIEEEITNIHDDIGNLYTNDQIDGMLDLKADKADVYTKTEVEGFLNDKADKSTTYTKSEVYTKTEVNDRVKLAGDFKEIKNDSYELNMYGGEIQLNPQRDSLCVMFGYNIPVAVVSNPNDIPITTPTPAAPWTTAVQFTSANGTCKVLWDNANKKVRYEESGCSYFGRHLIVGKPL